LEIAKKRTAKTINFRRRGIIGLFGNMQNFKIKFLHNLWVSETLVLNFSIFFVGIGNLASEFSDIQNP
jgi:hypothetical protein